MTYADVWEFWLRNPGLADAVSFVTVHMLPYWEDDPQPVGRAVDHVVRVHERVRAAFPGTGRPDRRGRLAERRAAARGRGAVGREPGALRARVR